MSRQEYRSIIYAGSEDRNREYKQSFSWNRNTNGETMAKVTKSILAMSNLRDGGHIVIGVEEGQEGLKAIGVQNEHLRTFSYDNVADFVRNYAEPYARFALDIVDLEQKRFVVIAVNGFEECPVVCKKSYGNSLSEGVVYVRSHSGRPRSEPLSNYVDMRELLDLATERGIRRFLEMQARTTIVNPDDEKLFGQQVKDFS